MSLKQLPQIKAFTALQTMAFEPDPDALDRWNPAVRAAVEGDDNVISIYGEIGQDMFGDGITSRRIAGALRSIGKRDVTVNINSPGGDFFEGVAIYNLLREHPAMVTVKVLGMAASAASVIAMAGDRIEISEVGFLMVHNAWARAVGNRHDMRSAADTLEPFDDAMAGLYAARAGVDRSVSVEWMNKETWFGGQKAIDAGLADDLLEADAITEEKTGAANALRKVEKILTKSGLTRSESRSLLRDIKTGTQDAAHHAATQDAGADVNATFERVIALFK
ncbi:MAG: Clp protease ClpP [Alphaproteobacteria bacterium]|nr:Clp protease ClpP [Alphaproteobacteria bacterium]MBO6629155.1 Clp protease ClpP [Alphaproteobacteria bacterium]